MKAVVMEKVNDGFIVLAHDESMHSIPLADGIEVGDVVDVDAYLKRQPVRARNVQLRRIAACAAALLVAVFGTFSYMTYDVSAAVTTDGDASIVYYLNHRGQVLRAEALNEAGEEVLNAMGGVKNRLKFEDVLLKTEKVMQEKGYLGTDESLSYEVDKNNDERVDEKKKLDKGTSVNGDVSSNGVGEKTGTEDGQKQADQTKKDVSYNDENSSKQSADKSAEKNRKDDEPDPDHGKNNASGNTDRGDNKDPDKDDPGNKDDTGGEAPGNGGNNGGGRTGDRDSGDQ